jgi:hypothetical protein
VRVYTYMYVFMQTHVFLNMLVPGLFSVSLLFIDIV